MNDRGKQQLPELQPWPDIDLKDITHVTNEILGRIAARDIENLFAIPVVEAFPEVAVDYGKVVKEPIDLRTIEEERIHAYNSIGMLQDDLILMFRNCCTYNGRGTFYFAYATERWEELNELFTEVCNEMGVLLPRRWHP